MSGCTKRATSTWTSCTCEPCLALRRRLGRLHRAGRITPVPHDAAWQRLDDWLTAGYSPAWIASAAGLTVEAVQHLATRSRQGRGVMARHNARALLSADIATATARVVEQLTREAVAPRALVASGLWEPAPGGWQFHDWEKYQPTRQIVTARREASAQRLREWRERKRDETHV